MNEIPTPSSTEALAGGRNLVVCCDGTSNQFSEDRTNVAKLCRILRKDRERQLVYHHPGVGTKAPPGFVTGLGAKFAKLAGLAFGYGLKRDIVDAYVFIMTHFRPGDKLFVFGFSRGAYTARALVALIKMYGLLMPGNDAMVPYLVDMFWAIDKARDDSKRRDAYFKLAADFKSELATRDCKPHFVGVWDTVSSVGWIGSPTALPYTHDNPDIAVLRHAVALDERRAFFRTNFAATPEGQNVRQIWFAGAHGDVGGGYLESQSGLLRIALLWMLEEAQAHDLIIEDEARAELVHQIAVDREGSALTVHDSMTWKWWPAEYLPKLRYDSSTGRKSWSIKPFTRRNPGPNPILHDSVWTLPNYPIPPGARKASEIWQSGT
ncbi:T6SS phospholipase effector Tle1-like catalytic domain-containing protein [Agrobacterium radiobacter]|uniref:T6SS phospholipase effector Tle1-like catalytic domain-containing protein n=1 Tax=Agrobacterium radiobacter TaxID=362 RepID=UPI003F85CCD4